jgi:hypothetical protein
MKTIIHVNQHVIKSNRKHGLNNPPLTIKTYKENRKGHTARIMHDGVCVAEIVHRPEKPLSCGAVIWIESHHDVEVSLEQDGTERVEDMICEGIY